MKGKILQGFLSLCLVFIVEDQILPAKVLSFFLCGYSDPVSAFATGSAILLIAWAVSQLEKERDMGRL